MFSIRWRRILNVYFVGAWPSYWNWKSSASNLHGTIIHGLICLCFNSLNEINFNFFVGPDFQLNYYSMLFENFFCSDSYNLPFLMIEYVISFFEHKAQLVEYFSSYNFKGKILDIFDRTVIQITFLSYLTCFGFSCSNFRIYL